MGNNEEILLLFRKNEQQGFRLLYASFYDPLILFATQLLGDAEEAADVVQECFVDFWANRRFNSLRGSLEHYLYSAVKIREELYDEEEGVDPELVEKLYRSMESLPEERRRILHMVCMEGMKYQEVAAQLGVSINTVKTQMGRSLQFLRKALKTDDYLTLLFFLGKK